MSESKQQYEIFEEPCRKEGLTTLKLIQNSRSFYIHSKYDPVSEAEKMVKSLPVGVDTVYFIFGLGMGYHAKALLGRMSKDNRIVIFEPSEAIYKLFISNENNKEFIEDKRTRIVRFSNENDINSVLQSYYQSTVAVTKNQMFIHPVYKEAFIAECKEFAVCVKGMIISCFLKRNTYAIFSEIWFKSILDNMSFLWKSWSNFAAKDLYKGIPAVIVSAGPSLEKNIDLLKELSGRAVIISVDTAYAPLYNRGIEPDFVVSVDAQTAVLRKFNGTDAHEKDLITTYMSSAEVQEKHTGRIMGYDDTNLFLKKCYRDLGITLRKYESGGSVACTAFDAAYKMGADPVILIGQDLAYTGNVSHVKGTPFYREAGESNKKFFEVDSIDGGKVMTIYNLDGYRRWFELFISTFDNRTYIDATEGGAKINGTQIMTFREVIDKYCQEEYDICERKKRIFCPENKTATKEQCDKFIDDIEKSGKYLKKIVSEIDICISLAEKIVKEVERNGFSRPERISNPYERIKKLNKSLKKNEHYVDLIYSLIATERDAATRTDHTLNSHLTDEQLLFIDLSKLLNYFKALSEKIKYACPLIDEAVQKGKKDLEVWENGQ